MSYDQFTNIELGNKLYGAKSARQFRLIQVIADLVCPGNLLPFKEAKVRVSNIKKKI